METYPDEVVLIKGTPVYDFLLKYSDLLKEMTENNTAGQLTLGPWLFGDDITKWHLFYDTFFPEAQIDSVFLFTKNARTGENIVGVRNPRGSIEAVRELFDYLMIDTPKSLNDRIVNIAKTHIPFNQGMNKPRNTVPRGAAPQKKKPGKAAAAARKKLVAQYGVKGMKRYNYNGFANNNSILNNESENEGIQLGLTEEEEGLREVVAPSLRKYLTSNLVSRKAKRTKKTMKELAKTRRQVEQKKFIEQLYKSKYGRFD